MRLCNAYLTAKNASEREEREKLFEDIQNWYIDTHKEYERLLMADMLSNFADHFSAEVEDWDSISMKEYRDNTSAKENLFNRVEHTCKLMLSVYTYGPDSTFPATFKMSGLSWFSHTFKFHVLIELVQAQLKTHDEGGGINLAVFLEDRSVRNDLTHNGKALVCVSAIRCYNVLREMLIFLDPECRAKLPRFKYPEEISCNSQFLIQQIKNIDFRNESTMLIVSPLHDLKSEALTILSNLPWSVVVDLDGYSSFGGLSSTAKNPRINHQLLNEQTAKYFTFKRDFTAWFTCGEFANFTFFQPNPSDPNWESYLDKNKIRFDGKIAFGDQYQMSKCIKPIIQEFSGLMRPLNILYIHDYDDEYELARSIINECEQAFHKKYLQYSLTAVYYDLPANWAQQQKKLERAYSGSGSPSPLNILYCDLDSMAEGLIQYQQELPIIVSKTEPFRLPSDRGMVSIGPVLANNLSDCFDALYDDAGEVSEEQADEQLQEFFRGGAAEWSVFRSGEVVSLYPFRDYDSLNLNYSR